MQRQFLVGELKLDDWFCGGEDWCEKDMNDKRRSLVIIRKVDGIPGIYMRENLKAQ